MLLLRRWHCAASRPSPVANPRPSPSPGGNCNRRNVKHLWLCFDDNEHRRVVTDKATSHYTKTHKFTHIHRNAPAPPPILCAPREVNPAQRPPHLPRRGRKLAVPHLISDCGWLRGRWPLAAGRWPLAAGRWPPLAAAGRWPLAAAPLAAAPLAAGRWPLRGRFLASLYVTEKSASSPHAPHQRVYPPADRPHARHCGCAAAVEAARVAPGLRRAPTEQPYGSKIEWLPLGSRSLALISEQYSTQASSDVWMVVGKQLLRPCPASPSPRRLSGRGSTVTWFRV
jgi:hypothetical protein